MNQKEKKRFAPLQAYEDKSRAIWYLLGAGTVLIIQILTIIFH